MIEPIEKFEALLTRFEHAVIDRSISNFSESIEWDYITSRAALTDAYREALEANEPRWHWVEDGDLPELGQFIWVLCDDTIGGGICRWPYEYGPWITNMSAWMPSMAAPIREVSK